MHVGRIFGALLALTVLLAVGGCAEAEEPIETPSSVATASGSPVADPDGSATDNQAAFDATLTPLIPDKGVPDTDAVVAALEDAGYPADQIEVTASVTPTGLDADSLDVAVRFADDCLVGQFLSGFRSEVLDQVNGRCLIGATVDLGDDS